MDEKDSAQVSSLISCMMPFIKMGQNEVKSKSRQISSDWKEKQENQSFYVDLKILKM